MIEEEIHDKDFEEVSEAIGHFKLLIQKSRTLSTLWKLDQPKQFQKSKDSKKLVKSLDSKYSEHLDLRLVSRDGFILERKLLDELIRKCCYDIKDKVARNII